MQVPCGRWAALGSTEQDRFSRTGSGSLWLHLGGRGPGRSLQCLGSSCWVRSPFSWPACPALPSWIQASGAARVPGRREAVRDTRGRGSPVCHRRFGTRMTSVPLSSAQGPSEVPGLPLMPCRVLAAQGCPTCLQSSC